MVKVLFDTNIIVAALSEAHEMHDRARPWLEQVQIDRTIEGFISTHSFAESYSILTRLPPPYRISPANAERLLSEDLTQFTRISLTAEDYQAVLRKVVQMNISGGGIYDTLIAYAALKANVDMLLTFNVKHFVRLGEEVAQLVQLPD
ncbi:PIN domain-containing protein [Leptolyngbya boryana CZ1]|uniref:Ribonuclease VapC n=1 Tax=Leptolyngbya boryana CZ1 TaxID=3060204 RepID=A0AA96WUV1_LEPBY|nr:MULTISPECIES: PIN domain-containing protein [Leptolyngbya]MBD1857878.1 PIN domain-containing protein [Leptolyngbya sp. FACHB-1624]WNZ46396.1 PIN domain-containing protein [Leptolyngbya boryana CZ1]